MTSSPSGIVWHWREPDLNSYRLAKPMNFREFLNKLIIFRVQEVVFNLSISSFCPAAWFCGFQCVVFNRKHSNASYLRLSSNLSQDFKNFLFKISIFPFVIFSKVQQKIFLQIFYLDSMRICEILRVQWKRNLKGYSLEEFLSLLKKINFLHSSL